MVGQADYAYAAKMRDVIYKLVRKVLEQERPRYRYASIVSIDRANLKCVVQFTDPSDQVTVSMGSIQPATTGQRVRIEGLPGDKFIADVIGPTYLNIQLTSTTTAPAAGSAAALPATPAGYLTLSINGQLREIAYY